MANKDSILYLPRNIDQIPNTVLTQGRVWLKPNILKPIKNQPIDISNIKSKDSLFYASVEIKNGQLVESGSRTMAIVGKAETITKAEKFAEEEICLVKGPLFHRKDIGTEKLIKEKVDQMNSLR